MRSRITAGAAIIKAREVSSGRSVRFAEPLARDRECNKRPLITLITVAPSESITQLVHPARSVQYHDIVDTFARSGIQKQTNKLKASRGKDAIPGAWTNERRCTKPSAINTGFGQQSVNYVLIVNTARLGLNYDLLRSWLNAHVSYRAIKSAPEVSQI
jgi:hypothetical protein